MPYRCLFFDLDHTLWDYDTNSDLTLDELYDHHRLADRGVNTAEAFREKFKEVNKLLWEQYDLGLIHRDVIRRNRFREILQYFQVDDKGLSLTLSDHYITECPKKRNLMPGAIEVLEAFNARYPMTVVTNGFDEVQKVKMDSSGLTQYFSHVVTSEIAKAKKPAMEIFLFALGKNGIRPNETVMIGDNLLTDMAGARNAGIDTVFYNPEKVLHDVPVNLEIQHLGELTHLL